MDREEKKMEEALDVLIVKCTDLKQSIAGLLVKLETPVDESTAAATGATTALTWPSALDSFAQIASQMGIVMRHIKSDPSLSTGLKNLVTLPVLLSPDVDEDLARLTESRVSCFNHDMVPHYLRTKLEPEIEKTDVALAHKALSMNPDQGSKAVNLVNKIVNQLTDSIASWRNDWEAGATMDAGSRVTSSNQDTNMILSAIATGKGLKGPPAVPDARLLLQQQQQQQQAQQQQQQASKSKAAPVVRTNIKTNVHPYSKS